MSLWVILLLRKSETFKEQKNDVMENLSMTLSKGTSFKCSIEFLKPH